MRGRANLGRRLAWVRRHWPDPVTALTAMIVYRGFGPLSHPETWGGFFEEVVKPLLSGWDVDHTEYDFMVPWIGREVNRIWSSSGRGAWGSRRVGVEFVDVLTPLFEDLDRIRDWARAERVDLGRLTWVEAIEGQRRWHEELAARAHAEGVSQAPVFLRLRGGWTWQELRPRHLKEEGEAMGHCVGGEGYAEQVAGGRSRILSLRDVRGRPHVTVEFEQLVTVADPTWVWETVQVQGKGDVPPAARYHPAVRRLFLRVLGPMASWRGAASAYWPDAFLWRQARSRWTREDLDELRGGRRMDLADREGSLAYALRAFAQTLSWAEGRSREGQDPLETGLASLRGWYWENGVFGLVLGFPWASLARGDAQAFRTALLEARWSWEDIDTFPREDADWLLGRAEAVAERAAASELDRDLVANPRPKGLQEGWRWERPLPRRTSPADWSVERARALVDRLLLSVDRWARRREEVLAETIRALLPSAKAGG